MRGKNLPPIPIYLPPFYPSPTSVKWVNKNVNYFPTSRIGSRLSEALPQKKGRGSPSPKFSKTQIISYV